MGIETRCERPPITRKTLRDLGMIQQPNEVGLLLALVLLAAAVVSVPIARALRLSAIVAYLAAGVVIGPFGLAVFRAPETILAVADLGVVLLLFLIGIELELSRL